MSLLNNPIPPKPSNFTPEGAPPGVAINYSAFRGPAGDWYKDRRIIRPRLQLVHTNAAGGEGSLQSQINWANASSSGNTHPHYCVNAPRPTKLVPTNRRAIANATVDSVQGSYGDVSLFSIAIETADAGWPNPGESGGFLYDHAEIVARILAYESITWGIPLVYPTAWHGAGTGTHSEPFGYPYWTLFRGKTCPGREKKRQIREQILPRARQIVMAWMIGKPTPTPIPTPIPKPTPTPTPAPLPAPTPPEEDEMRPIEPVRVYDTRNNTRPDGTLIPGGGEGRFKDDEVRKVPVVFGMQAFIHITVMDAKEPGFIAISSDGQFKGGTSAVNYDGTPGEVKHDGMPTLAPGGHIYVKAYKGCHIVIDTYAQG